MEPHTVEINVQYSADDISSKTVDHQRASERQLQRGFHQTQEGLGIPHIMDGVPDVQRRKNTLKPWSELYIHYSHVVRPEVKECVATK